MRSAIGLSKRFCFFAVFLWVIFGEDFFKKALPKPHSQNFGKAFAGDLCGKLF